MIETNIKIELVSNDKAFEDMKKIRTAVFVDEAGIDASHEFDGNDLGCSHLIAYDNDKPVGTMRIRYFGGFVKFERMAVIKEYRKTDVSDQIMNQGFEFVSRKGFKMVYGVCKKELLSRWEKCGYHAVDGAPRVEQNGMTLVPIVRELPENPEAIRTTTHPKILNAQEGNWDAAAMEVKVSGVQALFLKIKEKDRKKYEAYGK